MSNENKETVPPNVESAPEQPGGINTEEPQYDPGIVPQEVAARREREGDQFGSTIEGSEPGSIDTTGGNTVDQEGLANVYPVEPEMYVETPGDLRQEEEESKAARAQELAQASNDEETGKLTAERDMRGKGPGGISGG